MDHIRFVCPACETPLTVPQSAASATGPCPTCGETITGPGLTDGKSGEPARGTLAQKSVAAKESPETALSLPESAPEREEARETAPKLGMTALTATALLAVVAAFLLGYQAGQRSAALVHTPQATAPSQDTELTPDAGDLEGHLSTDTPPDESKVSPAKSALVAFLTAPDWTSRQVHILYPEQLVGQLEAVAQSEGDGPIEYEHITPVGLDRPDAEIFEVATKRFPKGLPVALQKTGDRWLVDWAAFAEFYYDAFRKFAGGPSGLAGTFRVHVLPHGDQPGHYTLSPPTAGEVYGADADPEGPVNGKITSVLEYYREEFPDQYELALKQGGPFFILQIAKVAGEDEDTLVIQDVVATSWAPRDPSEG